MNADSEIPDPVCYTRAEYRAGRKDTAVRVYTVNQESRYLIVRNVPSLNCLQELLSLFSSYGPIEESGQVAEPQPEFTESYWIKFYHLNNARFAKRKLDDSSFFGALLKVVYSPESESQTDTWHKLEERRHTVQSKIRGSSRPHNPGRPFPHPHPHPHPHSRLVNPAFLDPLLSHPPPPPSPPHTHRGATLMGRAKMSNAPEMGAMHKGGTNGARSAYNNNGIVEDRNKHKNALDKSGRSNAMSIKRLIGPNNSDNSLPFDSGSLKKNQVVVVTSRLESDGAERMTTSKRSVPNMEDHSFEENAHNARTIVNNGEDYVNGREVVNKRPPSDKRRRI